MNFFKIISPMARKAHFGPKIQKNPKKSPNSGGAQKMLFMPLNDSYGAQIWFDTSYVIRTVVFDTYEFFENHHRPSPQNALFPPKSTFLKKYNISRWNCEKRTLRWISPIWTYFVKYFICFDTFWLFFDQKLHILFPL